MSFFRIQKETNEAFGDGEWTKLSSCCCYRCNPEMRNPSNCGIHGSSGSSSRFFSTQSASQRPPNSRKNGNCCPSLRRHRSCNPEMAKSSRSFLSDYESETRTQCYLQMQKERLSKSQDDTSSFCTDSCFSCEPE